MKFFLGVLVTIIAGGCFLFFFGKKTPNSPQPKKIETTAGPVLSEIEKVSQFSEKMSAGKATKTKPAKKEQEKNLPILGRSEAGQKTLEPVTHSSPTKKNIATTAKPAKKNTTKRTKKSPPTTPTTPPADGFFEMKPALPILGRSELQKKEFDAGIEKWRKAHPPKKHKIFWVF